MKKVLFISILSLVTLFANGQALTFPDVASEEVKSLGEWIGNDFAVIVFVKQDCPYDKAYVERVEDLIDNNRGVRFIRVNSALRDKNASGYYKENNLSGIYLRDEKQALLKLLGARKSTESFLAKWVDGKFEIYYHGAIDSNPLRADDVREQYLAEAIAQVSSGEEIETKATVTAGCSLR